MQSMFFSELDLVIGLKRVHTGLREPVDEMIQVRGTGY